MDFTTVEKNLYDRGFQVTIFENQEEAVKYLETQINGQTVGFGGSVTLEQMGLYEALQSHNQVFWHWRIPEGKTGQEVKQAAAAAKVYISSVNALAKTGEIINIDGNCNRVSSIFYGHEKVYLILGENKIEEDYERALYRARNTAAPRNAKRLRINTPCAQKGEKCYDCKSPDRICRGFLFYGKSPHQGNLR